MRLDKLRGTILVISILLTSCGHLKTNKPVDPTHVTTEKKQALINEYRAMLHRAKELRDPVSGWLVYRDCDSMLWSGKYAGATGVFDVDLRASEVTGAPGKFRRRITRDCWQRGESRSTWSRDMGLGLIHAAIRTGQLDILESHARYGKQHNWIMGEPLESLTPIYNAHLIGILFQGIFELGGDNDPARLWPGNYKSGFDDYKAHLQMWSLWLRASIYKRKGQALGPISNVMLERVKEHAHREPDNPFYWFVMGLFTGDMNRPIDLILREDQPVGTYVRCHELERCKLAERIFTADLILEHLMGKDGEDDDGI